VFPGNRFVSSSLLFVEPRVFILEIRIIFSRGGGGFQNTYSKATCLYRFQWFYRRTCSHTGNMYRFSCFIQNTCSQAASLYHVRFFCRSTCSYTGSLEYLFSYWTFVPFTLGGFPERLFSCSFFLGDFRSIFSHTCSLHRFSFFFQGMCSQVTSLYRFQGIDIEMRPR
jgi:hypothetical protein